MLGQHRREQGLACSTGHPWHNSPEGNFPDADAGLCPRASETVGLLWHEVPMGRMVTTSSTAQSGKTRVNGEAKPWCCAHPQPGRSILLERILRSPSQSLGQCVTLLRS